MELTFFEFKKRNFGRCWIMDGNHIISVKPPWNQYVKGLASQAINDMYICAEADLSKMLLYISMDDNVKVFDYTPSEREKITIINLLGEKHDGHKRLGSKQTKVA